MGPSPTEQDFGRPLLPDDVNVRHDHRGEIQRVVSLALTFCAIFMPFSAAQNFQTSQADPVLGSRALSLLYSTLTLSNLVAGRIVQLLGLKPSMFLGSLTYIGFVFANISYRRWMVYSSSALLGVGASLLWAAQGAFVTRVAHLHDVAVGRSPASSLGYFNGVFFSIFQSNQFVGNLITAVLFQKALSPSWIFEICTVACAIGSGTLLLVRAPALETKRRPSWASILKSALEQFTDRRLLLLVPFMLLNGATLSFIVGDLATFPLSNHIRFLVMACWGGFDALASIAFGKLSDHIGRAPVIVLGVGVHGLVTVILLQYDLARDAMLSLFAFAFFFGIVDAIYNTSVYAIIGQLFMDPEPAFANFKLFQSGMIAAAFFYREFTDLRTRLNIILLLILVSTVCLYALRKRVHSL